MGRSGVLAVVVLVFFPLFAGLDAWAGPAQVSKLGVGVAVPGADLHVAQGMAASRPSDLTSVAPALLIENSDPDYSCASLALLAGTGASGASNIYFGNAGANSALNRGRIRYTDANDRMSFFSRGNETARLTYNAGNATTCMTLAGPSGSLLALAPRGSYAVPWSGYAGLFSFTTGTQTTELYAWDGAGGRVVLGAHHFSLYAPAPDDPAPWSFYSQNAFTGKAVNADISGALRALEALTGQKFLYYADLPRERIVDAAAWAAQELERRTAEAKQRAIDADPWVEVPFAEAWEEAPETVKRTVLEPVTKFRINWETKEVESYVIQVPREVAQATGRTVPHLKAGITFDEDTGKCLRARTFNDVALPPSAVPAVELPAYVKTRLPR